MDLEPGCAWATWRFTYLAAVHQHPAPAVDGCIDELEGFVEYAQDVFSRRVCGQHSKISREGRLCRAQGHNIMPKLRPAIPRPAANDICWVAEQKTELPPAFRAGVLAH